MISPASRLDREEHANLYLAYISPISRLYLAYITRSGADAAKFLADLAELIETDMESLLY